MKEKCYDCKKELDKKKFKCAECGVALCETCYRKNSSWCDGCDEEDEMQGGF